MPLPRTVASSSPGLPGCDSCQPVRIEKLGIPGLGATLESRVAELAQELVAMRMELAQLSTSQAEVQLSMGEVKDGITCLLSVGNSPQKKQAPQLVTMEEPKLCAAPPPPAVAVEAEADTKPLATAAMDAVAVVADESEILRCETKASISTKRSTAVGLPDPEEERETLKMMFTQSETEATRAIEMQKKMENKPKYLMETVKTMDRTRFELMLDSLMGAIILINAAFIGISMDHSDSSTPWIIADSVFSFIFITEISIKLKLHGCGGHFCGPMRFSNCFDATLVAIDLTQLSLLIVVPDVAESATGDMPAASLFRIVRLLKLARLLRLLRSEVFKDLLSMIQGMMGGFPTLIWSMVLFFLVVYITALLFREFFGKKPHDNVYDYFSNVPRSMLTTFRCAFGDCSSGGGVPIFEHVHEHYGAIASLFYCIFVFTITVGLFNVISAIFVESTMAAATELQNNKKDARMRDTLLWNTRITTLVRCLMEQSGSLKIDGKMSDNVGSIYDLTVENAVIDTVVTLPEGCQALLDLDIGEGDHRYLSDILDADNVGTCRVTEFIDGIRRLRGDPRRSDIVCVDLMVRVLQRNIADIVAKVTDMHTTMFPEEDQQEQE